MGEDQAVSLRGLFPSAAQVRVATPAMYAAPTLGDEAAPLARAVERRRAEFAAGRACARQALGALGWPAGPIPIGADRDPVWPAGFVGSITHCPGFCAAVAAPRAAFAALGVDAEDAGPLTPAVLRHVCGQAELAAFERLGQLPVPLLGKIAFSAKEAFYKAWFPLTRVRLAFDDVAVAFEPGPALGEGAFRVTSAAAPLGDGVDAFAGRWRLEGGLVLAGVSLAARGFDG